MTARPILFSAPMVRALLAGTKTQTRRVFKPDGKYRLDLVAPTDGGQSRCPYGQPGDQLWVRETWAEGIHQLADVNHWAYAADHFGIQQRLGERWKPSIHMPRAASRITLEITGVRVERLRDISVGDAIEEGCPGGEQGDRYAALEQYRALWESINGPGSWDLNPWVWVLEFGKVSQ